MKIMWNSVAPWIGTGYGQQTKLFVPRIRDLGNDVALSAYCGIEGTIGTWEGMPVYPADLTRMNKYMLRKYIEHFGEGDDVQVITLQDVWTWVEPKFGGMVADYHGLNLASWVPVDHDPCPPGVLHALDVFKSRPIAMSKFGEDRLRKAGLDPLYVPHGVDTRVLRPWEDRDAIRDAMKIPRDAFVVGMVANNQGQEVPRKAFPQVLGAFSVFLEKHPDAFLYFHTDMLGLNVGLNLVPLLEVYGIPTDRVQFVNQDRYWMGEIGWEQMGRVYSSMDVLMNATLGEGFGVPIIEAQACGTPVIATDWTAMPELVGRGWLVDGEPWYDSGAGSFWKVPALSELISALEMAYEARGDQKMRDEAREWALQFDVGYVTETFWKPALEALSRPREVKPLRPNRAMRRAAKQGAAA